MESEKEKEATVLLTKLPERGKEKEKKTKNTAAAAAAAERKKKTRREGFGYTCRREEQNHLLLDSIFPDCQPSLHVGESGDRALSLSLHEISDFFHRAHHHNHHHYH